MSSPENSAKQEDESQLSGLALAYKKAMPYINAVYVIIGSILMMGIFGWYGDKYFNSKPLFTIAGIFIGLGLGFYNFFKSLKELEEKNH